MRATSATSPCSPAPASTVSSRSPAGSGSKRGFACSPPTSTSSPPAADGGPHAPAVARATSSADGAFELSGVPVGDYRLWATPRGQFAWTRGEAFATRTGESTEADLELVPTADDELTRIVVVDPDGAPLRDVWLEVAHSTGGSTGFQPDGVATLGEGARYDVVAKAADPLHRYGPAELRLPELRGTAELRLVATPTREVTLRVLGPDGAPPDSYRLYVQTLGAPYLRTVESDTHLVRLPDDQPFTYRIDAEGCALATGELVGNTVADPWVVQLSALVGIEGRVTRGGVPVAGASVRVSPRAESGELVADNGELFRVDWRSGHDATTDAEGRFHVALQEAGDFSLRARASGTADALVDLPDYRPAVGRTGLEIELGLPGAIEGTVRRHDGSPAPGEVVVAAHPEHAGGHAVTDEAGRFAIDSLSPGEWFVHRGDAPRRAPFAPPHEVAEDWRYPANCTVRAGTTSSVELVLPDPEQLVVYGSLTIRGAEVEGLSIELAPDRERDPFAREWSVAVELDEAGRFELRVPEVGALLARVYGRRLMPVELPLVMEERPVELELELPVAEVAGAADPAAEGTQAQVRLGGAPEGAWRFPDIHLVVGPEGTFGPVLVPAGALRLELRVGFRDDAARFTADEWLDAGDSRTVELR